MMIFFNQNLLFAQVITNEGAALSLTPGIVVSSKDLLNNAGGDLLNHGTFNLSGDFTNSNLSITGGNGLFRLWGNWTNTGVFNHDLSTVIFNGTVNQLITRPGGEFFHNLTIANRGITPDNRVSISDNVDVTGTLSLESGNVDASAFIFYLSNKAAASLNYTSLTGSRIFGKFERGINETSGTYLFPLGTLRYYNPVNLKINNIVSAGSVLSQLDTLPAPGDAGLPVPDPPVEIAETFPDGFWSLTAKNTFSSNNYNINLNATGFADTIWSTTRVVKRISGGDWVVDGTHQVVDTVNNVIYRNNLTGGISPAGTQYALGRAHPLITLHPVSQIVCEHTSPVFTVTATGATPLTYRWYKDGVFIANSSDYSGARSNTLTVIDVELSDAGNYYCIVSDRYRNKTSSDTATLIINKIPVATVSTDLQPHECSNIAFDDIVLGLNYWDPGTTFVWERNEPDEIETTIPVTGTASDIGDVLGGSFTNTSDDPVTITFIITPIGPGPTYCVGSPKQSEVIVNPTPRVIPVNLKPEMCYGGTTNITLTSPTHMTQGTVMLDFWTEVDGLPGDILGGMPAELNQLPGEQIKLIYQNTADSMRSVFYMVVPKNEDSGCNPGSVDTSEVKVHPRAMQSMFISTPFTCTGASAGVLTTVLSKVAKPDMIHWIRPWRPDTIYYSNNNSDDLEIHYAGNYKVSVTDNFGCVNATNYLYVAGAVFNSTLIVNETDTYFGTSCPGAADGEIWIWEESGSSAAPPYEFWLVRNGQDTVAHDTIFGIGDSFRKEITSLASGRYQLFIRDNNGCFNGDYPAVDIIEPDPITVTFEKIEYPGGYNVSCRNYSDGSVSVKTISGGNGGYTYKWYTYDGSITGDSTLSTLTGISAGKYYLLTTDLHNCTKLDSVTLTEPEGISLASSELSLSDDGSFNISCAGYNNGSIKITIIGGSGNYNYLWSNGATTSNISNLVAGTYTATVTDQANTTCILMPQPSFTLTEPDTLEISTSESSSVDGAYNINCNGGTGSVNITVTGGSTGTYIYTWSTSNGSGLEAGLEDQDSLTAGTYHLIVRDVNGCQAETDITLTEPPALETELIPANITCASPGFDNGEIDLTVTGGVATYGYAWSNGETSEDITGLTQGYYKVTVTDFNGCHRVDSVRINLPPPMEFNTILSDYNGYNVSCYGLSDGSINITTTSGAAPYIFSWQKIDGVYTAATEDISGLEAGQYSLVITDNNLCKATDTIEISEPGRLDMTVSLSSSISGGHNISCAGTNTGSIDIVPVNQAGTVSYLWSDGASSQNRQNLFAGSYGLIITDSNNCLADSTITLTEPDSLKLVFDVSPPWCSDKPDGHISVTASGGVVATDYNYRWSDNSTGRNITDIISGLYKVTITDLNGCSVKDSVYVEPQHETCLIIPNAISPNGDLINDEWNIGLIELYPQIEIKIFNRWGEIIWRSEKGYPHPWDGKSNGEALPIDSYHYIIDYNNGRKPLVGNITIVR